MKAWGRNSSGKEALKGSWAAGNMVLNTARDSGTSAKLERFARDNFDHRYFQPRCARLEIWSQAPHESPARPTKLIASPRRKFDYRFWQPVAAKIVSFKKKPGHEDRAIQGEVCVPPIAAVGQCSGDQFSSCTCSESRSKLLASRASISCGSRTDWLAACNSITPLYSSTSVASTACKRKRV
jgi:hypothetical protein